MENSDSKIGHAQLRRTSRLLGFGWFIRLQVSPRYFFLSPNLAPSKVNFCSLFYHYTLGYRKHAQHDHICVDIDECSEELVTCFDPELWRQSRPELRQELNLFTSECINYAGQRVFHFTFFTEIDTFWYFDKKLTSNSLWVVKKI